jgi:YidC/Oxa1 family membrane protein insertase
MILGLVHLILGSPLTPLENLLRHVLNWLHSSIGLTWAWSIVGLTVIVRLLLVPLTVRQIHSMQNLQRHAPQMKEIQKKYKADKKRQQEELMKFYRENNINPAASCLPLLAQFPVFIALYLVLRQFSKHPPAGDLSWLHGLVPNIAAHANAHWSGYLLLAVYVASQLVSTFLMSSTMDRSQRIMMMVLPLFFVTFLLRFPVGLVIYWVTTNLWTVGQGLITRRLMPRPQPPEKRSSRTPPQEPAPAPAPAAAPEPAQPPQKASSQPRRVKRKKKKARR